MEVPVARMADDRRDEVARLDIALGVGDALRQPRNRYADVRHDGGRAGSERLFAPKRHGAAPPTGACDPSGCGAH